MAKGKYADIVDTLPRSLGTEPGEQEKINAVKAKILAPVQPDEQELSAEVLEDLILEVAAMQKMINEQLIRGVGPNRTASRYAQLFKGVRLMKDTFNEQQKVCEVLKEAYGQLLTDQYEVEGITTLGLEEGGTIRIQYEPHGTVVDKDANRKWAIANELENLLSLPWQTVNALTKEALLRGEAPPDGVTAETRTKIVYTKG